MKNPNEIRVVFMGTPGFAVAPLKTLFEKGYNVCAVVTAPDKPVGRGLKMSMSDVKEFALANGIKIFQPLSLKDESFLDDLKALNAHIFVVVAFRMLPKAVWSIPEFGTFNLHASLLPQYRGAAPINHAIMNGEKKSGVTTFLIDEKIDTGEVLLQRECQIGESETAGELHDKLMMMGAYLVCETVDLIINGQANAINQSSLEIGNKPLKEAPKLDKNTGKIDWNSDSVKIFNLIRGLSPYPASYSTLIKDNTVIPVKIYSATREDGSSELAAGEILTDEKTYLKVSCNNGLISITSIQAAGKKRLNIREFLAGFRDISLYKFE